MRTSLHLAAGAVVLLLAWADMAAAQRSPTGYWEAYRRPAYSGGVPAYLPAAGPASPAVPPLAAPTQLGDPAPLAAPFTSLSDAPPAAPPHPAAPAASGSGAPCGEADVCSEACGVRSGQWMFGVDALFLERSPSSSFALVKTVSPTFPSGTATTCLDTADIDSSMEFGYRVTGSYMNCEGWGLEVGFFTVASGWDFEWSKAGNLEFNGPGFSYPALVDTPIPAAFSICNESDFYSTEVNVLHGLCDWATLRLGVRWISFDDTLRVHDSLTPLAGLLTVATQNDPVGPQVGGDFKLLELWDSRFRINATMNVGMLYNKLDLDMASTYTGVPVHGERSELAVLGEAGVTAKLRLTDHIAVRGGYQILGIHGVGVAADQIAVNDVTQCYGRVESGSLIVHGASVGLEFFW